MGENFLMPEASHAWHVSPLYLLACHYLKIMENRIITDVCTTVFNHNIASSPRPTTKKPSHHKIMENIIIKFNPNT